MRRRPWRTPSLVVANSACRSLCTDLLGSLTTLRGRLFLLWRSRMRIAVALLDPRCASVTSGFCRWSSRLRHAAATGNAACQTGTLIAGVGLGMKPARSLLHFLLQHMLQILGRTILTILSSFYAPLFARVSEVTLVPSQYRRSTRAYGLGSRRALKDLKHISERCLCLPFGSYGTA